MIIKNNSRWLLFLSLSVMTLVLHGVPEFLHLTYNLDAAAIRNIGGSDADFQNSFSSSRWSIQYYYLKYFVPFLEYGIIFILISLIIKFLFLVLLYKVSINLGVIRNRAILASVLFIFAPYYHSHGIALNGIWVGPIIFNASLSTILSLAGLILYLKRNILFSSVLFSLSIHFHPLYGMTFLAWFSLGMSLIEWKYYNFDKAGELSFAAIIILLNVLTLIILSGYEVDLNITEEISRNDWFEIIKELNPDDAFLIHTIKMAGYSLIPLVSLGFYLSIIEAPKNRLDYLMIGVFLTTLIIIFIELLHLNNFFFSKMSDYFISLQLRRGFWVASLVSLLVIIKYYRRLESIFHTRSLVLISMLLVMLYLMPSSIGIIIFFSWAYISSKNIYILLILLMSLLLSLYSYKNGYMAVHVELKSLAMFSLAVFVYFSIGLIGRYKKIINKDLSYPVSLILIIFIISATTYSVYQGKFYESFSSLIGDGISSKVDYKTYANHHNNKLDIKIADCIQGLDNEKKNQFFMQLSPLNLAYSSTAFYGIPNYLNQSEVVAPILSRKLYYVIKQKLVDLYGEDVTRRYFLNYGYNKRSFGKYFGEAHTNISINDLMYWFQTHNIRYYVTNNPRHAFDKARICKSTKLNVYDLSLIKLHDDL